MTNSNSTLTHYIKTEDYEKSIVAEKILKSDHLASTTALKYVMLTLKAFDFYL